MSDTTTWAVLSDGRYIKVMVHNGTRTKFSVLDADKNEALAQLCYQMVNCKPMLSGKETARAEKLNFIQQQADFLSAQHKQNRFDRLVIAAPQAVIKSLRDALPEQLNQLVVGELEEDILMKPNNILDNMLAKLIIEGK
jgi:protein required for attachment to host cells